MLKNLQIPTSMLYIRSNKRLNPYLLYMKTSEKKQNKTVLLTVEESSITRYPAMVDEYGLTCKGFGGYRVELARLSGLFAEIRFRGQGNGENVVCGYIIDQDGFVESVANSPADADGYAVLPLTAKSYALFASVPLHRGKPVWDEINVELS